MGEIKGRTHLKLVKTQKKLLGFKETTTEKPTKGTTLPFDFFPSKKYFNICRKEKVAQCNLKVLRGNFTDCED